MMNCPTHHASPSISPSGDISDHPSARWLRCLRVLRIFRLAFSSPPLISMLRTLMYATPSIANITLGIFIFTFAYAVSAAGI